PEPARVESPLASIMSAPSAAMARPRSTAFLDVKYSPPSENESGVIFNTPMINPCRERSKTRSPTLQILARITIETSAGAQLFERGAPVSSGSCLDVGKTIPREQGCSAGWQALRTGSVRRRSACAYFFLA